MQQNNQSRQLVLASQSPRRKELLQNLGLEFTVHPSDFEEKSTHITATELATHNAEGKARDVAQSYPNAIVIGVDTVVAYHDHQLGKPLDDKDSKRILNIISGTTHEVITAIFIIDTSTSQHHSAHETTLVTLDVMTESEIKAYIASGEGHDKAGAYAIQGLGSLFVQRIEGDYFNVVGLPINLLRKMLVKFGIDHATFFSNFKR